MSKILTIFQHYGQCTKSTTITNTILPSTFVLGFLFLWGCHWLAKEPANVHITLDYYWLTEVPANVHITLNYYWLTEEPANSTRGHVLKTRYFNLFHYFLLTQSATCCLQLWGKWSLFLTAAKNTCNHLPFAVVHYREIYGKWLIKLESNGKSSASKCEFESIEYLWRRHGEDLNLKWAK